MITRQEFQRLLNELFDWKLDFPSNQVLTALVTNDTVTLAQIQTRITARTTTINSYLTLYDEAATPQAKMAVVSSVVKN